MINNSSIIGMEQDKLQNLLSLIGFGLVKQLYAEVSMYPDDEDK